MTVSLIVKEDIKELTRDLDRVQKRIVPRVTSQALNRSAQKVQTESVRALSRVKNIKQKLIRRRFRVRKASPKRLFAVVSAYILGIKAAKLGNPRQTKAGARVGSRSFPGQFVATMPSGHLGIFKRKGKPRLPIKEATIPLQPEAEQIINDKGRTIGKATFLKEFNRLLALRLNRKG